MPNKSSEQFSSFLTSKASVGSIKETGAPGNDANTKGYITSFQYGHGKGRNPDNQNVVFLFGENIGDANRGDVDRNLAGNQAAIIDRLKNDRGPNANAVGVVTTGVDSITDAQFANLLNDQLDPVIKFVQAGGRVVYPAQKDGKHNLGTGIAGLSPARLKMIDAKLDEIKNAGKGVTPKPLNDPELQKAKATMNQELAAVRAQRNQSNGIDRATTKKALPNTPSATPPAATTTKAAAAGDNEVSGSAAARTAAATATTDNGEVPGLVAREREAAARGEGTAHPAKPNPNAATAKPAGATAGPTETEAAADVNEHVLKPAYERYIKISDKRKGEFDKINSMAQASSSAKEPPSTPEQDAASVAALNAALQSEDSTSTTQDDTAFGIAHNLLSNILNAEGLSDADKIKAAGQITQEFATILTSDKPTKEGDAESIKAALSNIAANKDTNPALAALAKASEAKYAEGLQQKVDDVIAEHQAVIDTDNATKKAAEGGEKATPAKESPDPDMVEKVKIAKKAVGGVVAIAAMATASVFFPPLGVLLIAGGLAYLMNRNKKKDIEPKKESELEGEALLSAAEFAKLATNRDKGPAKDDGKGAGKDAKEDPTTDKENDKGASEKLTEKGAEEMEDNLTKVTEGVNASKKALTDAKIIAAGGEIDSDRAAEAATTIGDEAAAAEAAAETPAIAASEAAAVGAGGVAEGAAVNASATTDNAVTTTVDGSTSKTSTDAEALLFGVDDDSQEAKEVAIMAKKLSGGKATIATSGERRVSWADEVKAAEAAKDGTPRGH